MATPLLYNPAAGGGRGQARMEAAKEALAEANIDVRPVATRRPGHATELARELGAEHERLFVVGGDGTHSEVANGVLRLPKPPVLGLLPGGTGNDFLRDFGVLDHGEAVRRIVAGRVTNVDAIEARWHEADTARRRFSINIFGTGFASLAVDTCNRRLKWLGPKAYTAAVVVELARLRNLETTLVLDGEAIVAKRPFVTVCNTIHTGGAMKMAPDASPTDGKMDVLLVEEIGRLELARVLPKIFEGRHVEHPKVSFRQATHVRIEDVPAGPLLCDGEVVGTSPVDLRMKPGALPVLL